MAAGGVSAGSAVALPTLLVGSQPPVAPQSPRQGGTSMILGSPEFGFSGVTLDAGGNPLGGVTVHLFRTIDDGLQDVQVSDANGVYAFAGVNAGYTYYLVAYLPGSPDVSGTTLNTLIGS